MVFQLITPDNWQEVQYQMLSCRCVCLQWKLRLNAEASPTWIHCLVLKWLHSITHTTTWRVHTISTPVIFWSTQICWNCRKKLLAHAVVQFGQLLIWGQSLREGMMNRTELGEHCNCLSGKEEEKNLFQSQQNIGWQKKFAKEFNNVAIFCYCISLFIIYFFPSLDGHILINAYTTSRLFFFVCFHTNSCKASTSLLSLVCWMVRWHSH